MLLSDLRSDPQAAAFNMPVNWRALKLFDYPTIVKKPMDLQTIEERVRGERQGTDGDGMPCDRYQYVHEFVNDVNLVWSNCKLFNQIGSLIYRNAQSMERLSNRLLVKHGLVKAITNSAKVPQSNLS